MINYLFLSSQLDTNKITFDKKEIVDFGHLKQNFLLFRITPIISIKKARDRIGLIA